MRVTRWIGVGAGLFLLLTLYSNCAQDLPQEVNNYSSNSTETGPTTATGISASFSPAAIFTDQSSYLTVSGGIPPYSFSLIQGSGTLSSNGVLSGPLIAGNFRARVTDQSGQSVEIAITVTDRGAGNGDSPCTTPWGTSVPSGLSVVAFQSQEIFCPSTTTCQSETRYCNNGTLSGSFTKASCTQRACVYKKIAYSTNQYSGNSLCQISNDESGSYSSIPLVYSSSQIPSSCMAKDYHSSVICHLDGTYDGEGGTYYNYYKYQCVSATESPSVEYYNISYDSP